MFTLGNLYAIDSVILKSSKRCMFGDFDLIVQDFAYKPQSKFILSIYDINKKNEVIFPVYQDIFQTSDSTTKEEAKKIVTNYYEKGLRVSTPKLSEDGEYLVSVCNDSANLGTCQNGKKIEDIGTLLKGYQAPAKDFAPQDNVYFLQYLKIKNGESFFSDQPITNQNLKKIKSALGLKDKKITTKLVTLGSMPFVKSPEGIEMDLPVYSPKKCKGES